MEGKTAIIGGGEDVLAFKAGGVDAFTATDEVKAKELLRKLARTYKVIFITDDLAEKLDDVIRRTNEQAYPAVIPIPSRKGASGYAKQKMKEQMEKALGVDILFGNRSESDKKQ
ncbi:MAG: V-type ATP synthase subunit F [Clostridia bacterium]|nr:V-type ATP synthase subunit F [Clostridia bacterium]